MGGGGNKLTEARKERERKTERMDRNKGGGRRK